MLLINGCGVLCCRGPERTDVRLLDQICSEERILMHLYYDIILPSNGASLGFGPDAAWLPAGARAVC
jgi:hypothetical protein